MRFDFEGAGPAVANVDDAGILSRPLNDAIAFSRQPLQMNTRGFVGAVFAPHDAVNTEFGETGGTPEGIEDALIFVSSQAVLRQKLRGNGNWVRCHSKRLRLHSVNSIVARGPGFPGFILRAEAVRMER